MAELYIALPSYKSPEFSRNSHASFSVRLPNRLEFPTDDWEVALSALSFTDTSVDLSPLVQKPAVQLVQSNFKKTDAIGGRLTENVNVIIKKFKR